MQVVLSTVEDYNNLPWTNVQEDDTIAAMTKKMDEFQAACKRMPKVLREYEAFVELKRTIDDFLETLPLVQQLAHPAMRNQSIAWRLLPAAQRQQASPRTC